MQVDGLVAAILCLLVVFVHAGLTYLIAVEVVNSAAANSLIDVFHLVGMNQDANTNVL